MCPSSIQSLYNDSVGIVGIFEVVHRNPVDIGVMECHRVLLSSCELSILRCASLFESRQQTSRSIGILGLPSADYASFQVHILCKP